MPTYKPADVVKLCAIGTAEYKKFLKSVNHSKREGFTPGKPYQKVHQFVQPVYGKTTAAMFAQE